MEAFGLRMEAIASTVEAIAIFRFLFLLGLRLCYGDQDPGPRMVCAFVSVCRVQGSCWVSAIALTKR